MTDEEFLETFAPGVEFLYERKVYRVIKRKRLLSQNYMIVTDLRTFQKRFDELNDFLSEIDFSSVESMREQENIKQLKTKEIVEKTQNNSHLAIVDQYKSSATVSAKPVLADLLTQLSNSDVVSDELVKKANAICQVTKQIIEISKIEVDVFKTIQSNK